MSLLEDSIDRGLPLRTLVFDVETAPLLSYHWQVWKENIGPHQAVRASTFLLTWAAKWEGQKAVHSDSLTPEEAVGEDDSRIVESLSQLVAKADIVVAHNGDRFDLPVLNTRLLELRLDPLPPVKSVDTLKVAKRAFKFTYNRLSYLADFLGHESKHAMTFEDWRQAVKGDLKALRKMKKYCAQDVLVLENVWNDLKPYAKGLPRRVDAVREMQKVCPSCGSPELEPAGWHRTNASNFARYKCGDCGRYARSRSAAKGTKVGLHPL